MSDNAMLFRIHPAINFARLGTSEEFYLSPDTSAGMPGDGELVGGLPIQPETEDTPITGADWRDGDGKLKRQAARFRIFAYRNDAPETYPRGGGEEVRIGSIVGGKIVTDIVWTVHLANKKANGYMVVVQEGINAYNDGAVPQVRNPQFGGNPGDPSRLTKLVIDPGPRTISGASEGPVHFDTVTTPTCENDRGEIERLTQYPVSFPENNWAPLQQSAGLLTTLGELRTDEHGRLLVLGGYGRTAGLITEYNTPYVFTADINNAGWFDDASDGPVSATLVFDDGSRAAVHGAWVVCADPAYAPQVRNVVSIWDDVYDTFVRYLGLQPELYDHDLFIADYEPYFDDQILPIFRAAHLTRWTTNLPDIAIQAHEAVGRIGPEDDPDRTVLAGLAFIRNPNVQSELSVGVPLMPLSLGDSGNAFLALTRTQYFLLRQWSNKRFRKGRAPLGRGESLDMAALSNCLGGRYVPGIEMTNIVREPDLYETDWRASGSGPFRIKHAPLDYSKATLDAPFLTVGWIPRHNITTGLEPGDTSKFMAVPWQTDYNSCAIHMASINTGGQASATAGNATTLFWSWPAQRPIAVYVAREVVNGKLPPQRYSVRGRGTLTSDLKTLSTFLDPFTAMSKWDQIGVVLQGPVLRFEGDYGPAMFLETGSLLDPYVMVEWPFNANPLPQPVPRNPNV